MTGGQFKPDRGWWDGFVLSAVFALLLPALAVAVAPPVPQPEQPGPHPLFDPEQFHTNPVHMTMAVMGSPSIPGVGSLVTAGTLVAGEALRTWSLEGVMTNLYSRRFFGASMLVAGGFGIGTPPLAQIATLEYGHTRDCWALRDTDICHKLPEGSMNVFRDGNRVGAGGAEAIVYERILELAFFTRSAAFKKAARTDLTFTHLLDDPAHYRGKVIHVEGRLKQINRFEPPPEAKKAGVSDVFEAWVHPDQFGANPYVIVFTHWPEGLSQSYLGKSTISDPIHIKADGYFLKMFKYKDRNPRGGERDAPLVVAHSMLLVPTAVQGNTRSWINNLLYIFIGMLAILGMGVVSLTWWFRRNDRLLRLRLRARAPEFVLPTPDAPPQAPVPLAMPVKPLNGADRAVPHRPRITFPVSGKGGDRGDSPAATEGKAPDEGGGG